MNHNRSRLTKLAQAAKEQAGEMTVDDLIVSIERSAEANRRAYSRYRNFDMMGALREYATRLSKSVQNLTEGEKQQAFLDYALKKTEPAKLEDECDYSVDSRMQEREFCRRCGCEIEREPGDAYTFDGDRCSSCRIGVMHD